MEDVNKNNQSLEEKYSRLYEFTYSLLLAHNLPKDFEDNYEVRLAEKTIKEFKIK